MHNLKFVAVSKNGSRDGEAGWNVELNGEKLDKVHTDSSLRLDSTTMLDVLKQAGINVEFDFETGVQEYFMLMQDIIDDMNKALKMFGTYAFADKGAQEVMDLDKWVEKIRDLDVNEAIQLFIELADVDQYANQLARDLLINLQDWDELFENEQVSEMI